MAAPKGHPKYPGAGRKKGTPNKPKPIEQAMQEAVERYGPEKAAREILQAAMNALDNEVLIETDAGVIKKQIFNFEGAKFFWPYIASKKPEKQELTGKDGGPMTFKGVPGFPPDAGNRI